ncbi:MAG: universal stress protein [Promethearchaeota archaeon]
MEIYRKILLAVDGSKDSMRAAKTILEIKKKFGSKVVAFYAIENYSFPKIIMPSAPIIYSAGHKVSKLDFIERRNYLEKKAIKILNQTLNIFKAENLSIETKIIFDESPEDYVERIVEEQNFDLVALGYRGKHSKLKQIFTGSIAQKLLNDAPCDILVVR